MFLSLASYTFSCLSKHPKDTGNYVKEEKFMDAEYILQTAHMQRCIDELSPTLSNRLQRLKNILIQSAVEEVKQVLETADHAVFDKRGFATCIGIVALHKANTLICRDFEELYPDYDLIKKYAIYEYEECVRQKNAPYIRSINFPRPINFIDNLGLDIDQL
ncbi:hypothetical protein BDAP_002463 [Binucleata daphniae]